MAFGGYVHARGSFAALEVETPGNGMPECSKRRSAALHYRMPTSASCTEPTTAGSEFNAAWTA